MLTNYGRDIILDTDEIDDKDPTGTYNIGAFNPSFVGNCAYDPLRRYPPPPESDQLERQQATAH